MRFIHRTPRLREDWTLDGLEKAVAQHDGFATIAEAWPALEPHSRSICYWSGNMQRDSDDQRHESDAYWLWYLKNQPWIRVSAVGEPRRATDIFSGGEVTRTLVGWVASLSFESSVEKIFARTLGVRSGWHEVAAEDWRRWIDEAERRRPHSAEACRDAERQAIRQLYQAALDHAPSNGFGGRLRSARFWFAERHPDREEWKTRRASEGHYLDSPRFERLRLEGVWVFPVRLGGATQAERVKEHFGIKSLSQALNEEPEWDDRKPLKVMDERLRDRSRAIVAYLSLGEGVAQADSLRIVLKMIHAFQVSALQVRFSINGIVCGEERPSSWIVRREAEFGFYLLQSGAANPPSAWNDFAEAIVSACGVSPDKASNVRDLLTVQEGRELEDRLIRLGIAPEAVQELVPATKEEPAKRSAGRDHRTLVDEGQSVDRDASKPETRRADNRPSRDPAFRPGEANEIDPRGPAERGVAPPRQQGLQREVDRTNFPRSPRDVRPHPAEGRDAQEWLRERLMDAIPAGWKVSPGEQATPGDESRIDILLSREGSEDVLVEAKRIDAGRIYWSERQIEAAQSHPGRYFIAMCKPSADSDGYQVFWAWDPLSDLRLPGRKVKWTWRELPESAEFDEGWHPRGQRPEKSADSFRAVVVVDEEFLLKRDQDVGALVRRLNDGAK